MYILSYGNSEVNGFIQQINLNPDISLMDYVPNHCSAKSWGIVVSFMVYVGSLLHPVGREKRNTEDLPTVLRPDMEVAHINHFFSYSTGENKVKMVNVMPSYILLL